MQLHTHTRSQPFRKKVTLYLRVMACFLFFINCSKDSYDSFEKQSSFIEKDITFDRFKKESGLLDFENKFKIDGTLDAGLKKENTNKHVLNEFVIDTIVIKKLVRDKKTTYTFQVHPKNIKSNNIYNLTMFYKQGWQSILVELKPSKEYLLSLKQGVNSKFEGTISRLYQSNLSNSGKTSRSSQLNCTTIFVEFWHCTRTGNCASGTCDQCNLCVGYDSYRLCDSEPVGPDPDHIDAGGSTGGGGSGEGGSNITMKNDEIFIIPNLYEVIPFLDGGVNFNLDFAMSLKSPFNIDLSAIPYDITKPEHQKFNEVYKSLTESPEFQKLFVNLFQDSERFNVKFLIGNISNGANGNTNTDLNNPTLNTITISPTFLNSSNKMEIAKTIIHECIHAYLNVKLCDAGQGISIPTLNNLDYYNVVNQKYNGFNSSQDQHNFIYNFMLPTLKTILADVKDKLVTPANNTEMINDVVVHIPFDFSPSTPFTWTDYYHNLSLNGLQNCSFFQNEIGSVQVLNGVLTPTNTINQVLMQSFIQYIRVGQFNIHP